LLQAGGITLAVDGTKILSWTLVSLSYNLKRLYHMGARLAAA
jgi:hypothetical protein